MKTSWSIGWAPLWNWPISGWPSASVYGPSGRFATATPMPPSSLLPWMSLAAKYR
jgi:hypothetical protein